MKRILFIILASTFTMALNAQRSRTFSTTESKNRPWSIDFSTGYQFYTKGGDGVYAVNLGIQKQLSNHFSLGFTSGSMFPKVGGPIIPALIDARVFYPIINNKLDIIGIVRGGLYFDTKNTADWVFGFELLPGFKYHITNKFDIRINSGYQKIFYTERGDNFDMIPILIGASYKF